MKTILLKYYEAENNKNTEANKDIFLFDKIKTKQKTDLIRTALLKNLESNKELYNAFNYKDYKYPDVIYQKPYKNIVLLHLKENSRAFNLYSKFINNCFENPLKVKDKEYKLFNYSVMDNAFVKIPTKADREIKYNLITPLLLFTKKTFPIYYAICKKATSDKHREALLKEKASKMIIANLKWQLQQLAKYKKYEILDDIDINWKNFEVRFIDYHKGEKKTPAIFGSFTSRWELPKFIGQKIGKGFGQINMAKTIREES